MKTRTIELEELFSKRHDRIPVVTIEKNSGKLLGLNITNRQAFELTVDTGTCHYYDEVNKVIFLKGEHSGEIETILEIRLDCCHARRHELHLLYEVEMAEGHCMFGMSDCHFYRWNTDHFVLDHTLLDDPQAAEKCWQRITTLLDTDEDRKHQKRFKRFSTE